MAAAAASLILAHYTTAPRSLTGPAISQTATHVTFYFLFFFGLSGEASQGRVCYQRGLPRLVNRPGEAGAVL